MLKYLSIAFTVFVIHNVSGSEIIFNRLNSLYQKDAKKCLIVAKRYMDYLPNNATSYFFLAKIHEDKTGVSKSSRGKYLNVKRALKYASDFDVKSDDAFKTFVGWSDFKAELTKSSTKVISVLSENLQFDLSERLSSSLSSFNDEYFKDDLAIEIAEKNEINEVYKNINSTKVFFGMPSGAEVIKSADLSAEQTLLNYINIERQKLGMVKLDWEEGLAKASRYHAYDLGSQNYFNHSTYDRKNGRLVKVGGTFDRIKKFYSESYVNSENIAAGNSDAYLTYMQWYNSPRHYANMFNPESTRIGIGVAHVKDSPFGYYWSMSTAH